MHTIEYHLNEHLLRPQTAYDTSPHQD